MTAPVTLTPQERAANYERERLKRRKQAAAEQPFESASTVRDELLKTIAPLAGSFYDPKAMELIDRFETALYRDWEQGERMEVERRACDAVRNALQTISDGRLL